MSSESSVRQHLLTVVGGVIDPELRRPLSELDMLESVEYEESGHARIVVSLTIAGCPAVDRIERDVRGAALSVPDVTSVDIEMGVMSPQQRARLTERLRAGRPSGVPFTAESLTRVIAVTSGKGGVGKSSVTANLAVAMARLGLAVGIVDADVHGFSIPGLLGLVDEAGRTVKPTRIDDVIVPPVAYEVKTVSIGMFLRDGDEGAAVAWRGPMLHRTVQQFLTDVHFGDLDVLLIDMPPGTGDIAISVGQLLPHADVLVVTTPQTAAADVAVRSGVVARQTGQRVIGVVENMAPMTMADGSTLDLFGAGGGSTVARALSTPEQPVALLASVPLSVALRSAGDSGVPVVVGDPDDEAARAIAALASELAHAPRGLQGKKLPLSLR